MANFQLSFQSREQVVVRWGQIRRIGWVIKRLEAQTGQFLLVWKCPVNRGIVMQRTKLLWWLSRGVFLLKCPSIAQAEISNTPRWQFDPLEDKQRGDAFLIPKKSKRELFKLIFAFGIFLGGVSRHADTPLIVALSPGHSDITRFRPWSPNATGNHFYRAKKNSKSCSDDWHRWRFWSAFRHFGTHFAENFRMSKSSWMMDPTPIHPVGGALIQRTDRWTERRDETNRRILIFMRGHLRTAKI